MQINQLLAIAFSIPS